jgi:hypothetical protein
MEKRKIEQEGQIGNLSRNIYFNSDISVVHKIQIKYKAPTNRKNF